MKYHTKKIFSIMSYNKKAEPIIITFDLKYYDVVNENNDFIYINNVIFYKKRNEKNELRYFYDYFYTKQEERKLKLKKIKNVNKK